MQDANHERFRFLHMLGQYQRATEVDSDRPPYISVMAFIALGQFDEAKAIAEAARAHAGTHPHVELMVQLFEAMLTGRAADGRQVLGTLTDFAGFNDPEGWYYWAQGAAFLEDPDYALELLTRAVTTGFACPRALESTPLFDGLRSSAEFAHLVAHAREGHEKAMIAFAQADGHRLLGLPRA